MSVGIDWQATGGVLGAVGGVAAGLWAWFERAKRSSAAASADIAQSHAEESIYRMMTERLTALETDVGRLRDELAQERSHSRALERHIFKLEMLMRQASMDPPPFIDPAGARPT